MILRGVGWSVIGWDVVQIHGGITEASNTPCDPPCPCDAPMMLFAEITGHKYDFEGVGWSVIRSRGREGPDLWRVSWEASDTP